MGRFGMFRLSQGIRRLLSLRDTLMAVKMRELRLGSWFESWSENLFQLIGSGLYSFNFINLRTLSVRH